MGKLIGLCVSGFDRSLTQATSQTTHLRHERACLTLPPNLKATRVRVNGRARDAWWAEKAHSGTADQEVTKHHKSKDWEKEATGCVFTPLEHETGWKTTRRSLSNNTNDLLFSTESRRTLT